MAARSPAFAAMRRAVLAATQAIPFGKAVEIARLAESLNIPARHAAYILAGLTAEEADFVPAHRVVPAGGRFRAPARGDARAAARIAARIAALRSEGFEIGPDGTVVLPEDRLWRPDDRFRDALWADVAAESSP